MDFSLSPRVEDLLHRVTTFMDEYIYPAEKVAEEQVQASGDEHSELPIVKDLKRRARAAGLWNLFLPEPETAGSDPTLLRTRAVREGDDYVINGHKVRAVSVMGHTGGGGRCEVRYENCRVPATNLLGAEGGGFAIAQASIAHFVRPRISSLAGAPAYRRNS